MRDRLNDVLICDFAGSSSLLICGGVAKDPAATAQTDVAVILVASVCFARLLRQSCLLALVDDAQSHHQNLLVLMKRRLSAFARDSSTATDVFAVAAFGTLLRCAQ